MNCNFDNIVLYWRVIVSFFSALFSLHFALSHALAGDGPTAVIIALFFVSFLSFLTAFVFVVSRFFPSLWLRIVMWAKHKLDPSKCKKFVTCMAVALPVFLLLVFAVVIFVVFVLQSDRFIVFWITFLSFSFLVGVAIALFLSFPAVFLRVRKCLKRCVKRSLGRGKNVQKVYSWDVIQNEISFNDQGNTVEMLSAYFLQMAPDAAECTKKIHIKGNFLELVPLGLCSFPNLTFLDLSSNSFAVFPRQLCQILSLQRLFLQENPFQNLHSGLVQLRCLKEIRVTETKIAPFFQQHVRGNASKTQDFLKLVENHYLPRENCRKISLILIWAKDNGEEIFKHVPKDIVKLLSKYVYETRNDQAWRRL